ncbi:hypothetical protein NAPIS_ORF01562, partial [Vairimorpha apis BRL 01]
KFIEKQNGEYFLKDDKLEFDNVLDDVIELYDFEVGKCKNNLYISKEMILLQIVDYFEGNLDNDRFKLYNPEIENISNTDSLKLFNIESDKNLDNCLKLYNSEIEKNVNTNSDLVNSEIDKFILILI